MLTPSQLAAENQTALTDVQVYNLKMLIKQYGGYANNLGLFTDLDGVLLTEQTTPTIKTQGLKAVLTALDDLPELVVESQGTSDAPSHFSTKSNWDALALDALDTLYDLPAGLFSQQNFALAYAKLSEKDAFKANIYWDPNKTTF